jgi:hypothetical protein
MPRRISLPSVARAHDGEAAGALGADEDRGRGKVLDKAQGMGDKAEDRAQDKDMGDRADKVVVPVVVAVVPLRW